MCVDRMFCFIQDFQQCPASLPWINSTHLYSGRYGRRDEAVLPGEECSYDETGTFFPNTMFNQSLFQMYFVGILCNFWNQCQRQGHTKNVGWKGLNYKRLNLAPALWGDFAHTQTANDVALVHEGWNRSGFIKQLNNFIFQYLYKNNSIIQHNFFKG